MNEELEEMKESTQPQKLTKIDHGILISPKTPPLKISTLEPNLIPEKPKVIPTKVKSASTIYDEGDEVNNKPQSNRLSNLPQLNELMEKTEAAAIELQNK